MNVIGGKPVLLSVDKDLEVTPSTAGELTEKSTLQLGKMERRWRKRVEDARTLMNLKSIVSAIDSSVE